MLLLKSQTASVGIKLSVLDDWMLLEAISGCIIDNYQDIESLLKALPKFPVCWNGDEETSGFALILVPFMLIEAFFGYLHVRGIDPE